LRWGYGVEISQIKKDIEELEKLGATYIDIEPGEGEISANCEIFCRRIETDEEYEKRIEEDKKEQEEIKRRELKLLEELKFKYEK